MPVGGVTIGHPSQKVANMAATRRFLFGQILAPFGRQQAHIILVDRKQFTDDLRCRLRRRILRRLGFSACRAAPPRRVGGELLFACWIDVPRAKPAPNPYALVPSIDLFRAEVEQRAAF